MNCEKCGVEITDPSGKCPDCSTKTSVPKERPAQPKYKKPIVIAMGVLALLGIAALLAATVFKSRQSDITYAPTVHPRTGELLSTGDIPPPQENLLELAPPDISGSNVLEAPEAAPLQPDPGIQTNQKPQPPRYLLEYLEFVRGVEVHRQALLKDTYAALIIGSITQATGGLDALLGMLDESETSQIKDPMESTRNELFRQYQNWNNTLIFFGNRQPPQECQQFAAYYQAVLYTETMAIYRIIFTLNSAKSYDKQEVTQITTALQGILQGGAQREIDTAADNADRALDNLVAQYDMRKPFSVSRELGSGGSLMGF